MLFETILFPTDMSKNSEAPVAYITELARRYRSRIIVIHVVENLDELSHLNIPEKPLEELNRERMTTARKSLKEFTLRNFGKLPGVSQEVIRGIPYRAIVETARKKKASLIVMGIHGGGGLESFLIGSNVLRVVRTASCPVLTVRAKP